MSFAWNLRTLRTQNDLTQGELAEMIGVSQKTISSWETGRTEPTMNDVIGICKILDCPMEKLTGTKARAVGDITLEDILVKMRSLDVSELREVQKAIEETLEHREMKQKHMEQIKKYQAEIERLQGLVAKEHAALVEVK